MSSYVLIMISCQRCILKNHARQQELFTLTLIHTHFPDLHFDSARTRSGCRFRTRPPREHRTPPKHKYWHITRHSSLLLKFTKFSALKRKTRKYVCSVQGLGQNRRRCAVQFRFHILHKFIKFIFNLEYSFIGFFCTEYTYLQYSLSIFCNSL